jgi:hypothetical protein
MHQTIVLTQTFYCKPEHYKTLIMWINILLLATLTIVIDDHISNIIIKHCCIILLLVYMLIMIDLLSAIFIITCFILLKQVK